MSGITNNVLVVYGPTKIFRYAYASTGFVGGTVDFLDQEYSITNIYRNHVEVDLDPWGNCITLNIEVGDINAKPIINPLDIVEFWTKEDHETEFTCKFVGECVKPPPTYYLNRDEEPSDIHVVGFKERLKYTDTGRNLIITPFYIDGVNTIGQYTLGYVVERVLLQSQLPDYITLGDAIPFPAFGTSGYFPTLNEAITGSISSGGVDIYQFMEAIVALAREAGKEYTWGVNAQSEIFIVDKATTTTRTLLDENALAGLIVTAEKPDASDVVNAVRWHISTANMRYGFALQNPVDPSVADPLTAKVANTNSYYDERCVAVAVPKDVNPLKSLAEAGTYGLLDGNYDSSYLSGVKDTAFKIDRVWDDPFLSSWITVKAVPDPAPPYWKVRLRFQPGSGSLPLKLSDIFAAHIELTEDSANQNKIIGSIVALDISFNGVGIPSSLWGANHKLHYQGAEDDSTFYTFGKDLPKIDEWLFTGDYRRYLHDALNYGVTTSDTFILDIKILTETNQTFPVPLIAIKDFQIYSVHALNLQRAALNEYKEPTIESLTVRYPGYLNPATARYDIKLLGNESTTFTDLEGKQLKYYYSSDNDEPLTFVSIGNAMGSIFNQAIGGQLQVSPEKRIASKRNSRAISDAALKSYLLTQYNKDRSY